MKAPVFLVFFLVFVLVPSFSFLVVPAVALSPLSASSPAFLIVFRELFADPLVAVAYILAQVLSFVATVVPIATGESLVSSSILAPISLSLKHPPLYITVRPQHILSIFSQFFPI